MKSFVLLLTTLVVLLACNDPCKNVVCNNGGYCANGACECPPAWSGPGCNTEVAPIKMRVGEVVAYFPSYDANSQPWDFDSPPDVYFVIQKDGQTIYTSNQIQDATDVGLWVDLIEFSDPTATYSIFLFDYDSLNDDDFMGGISFTPYLPGQGFPNSITLDCNNCTVSFELNMVQYFHA